jgi:hypothetical protein
VKLTKFRYDECGNFRVAVTERITGNDITLQAVTRSERGGVRKSRRLARRLRKLKAGLK